MIAILDESVLPQPALDVLNIIVLLYVVGLTPLLMWLAYRKHRRQEAETALPEEQETAPEEELPEEK
ncbi:MAG: hypothetical protein IJ561_04995 [Ruminococcus sp.]|nr:hypothetical protein [Ruminococcus sp.]